MIRIYTSICNQCKYVKTPSLRSITSIGSSSSSITSLNYNNNRGMNIRSYSNNNNNNVNEQQIKDIIKEEEVISDKEYLEMIKSNKKVDPQIKKRIANKMIFQDVEAQIGSPMARNSLDEETEMIVLTHAYEGKQWDRNTRMALCTVSPILNAVYTTSIINYASTPLVLLQHHFNTSIRIPRLGGLIDDTRFLNDTTILFQKYFGSLDQRDSTLLESITTPFFYTANALPMLELFKKYDQLNTNQLDPSDNNGARYFFTPDQPINATRTRIRIAHNQLFITVHYRFKASLGVNNFKVDTTDYLTSIIYVSDIPESNKYDDLVWRVGYICPSATVMMSLEGLVPRFHRK